MSYSLAKHRIVIPISEGTLGTANELVAWIPKFKMQITNVYALVTTVLAAFTVEAVLSISLAGTEKDTITLTKETAVGTELKGAGTSMPFDVASGDVVSLAVKTAATGTTTGAVSWIIECIEIP